MSSTAKSSVALQKAAGKRAAEDIGDLNNTNKKMKGNRGRPWMDDSEGRVIHTAGKTQLPRQKDQEKFGLFLTKPSWLFQGGLSGGRLEGVP